MSIVFQAPAHGFEILFRLPATLDAYQHGAYLRMVQNPANRNARQGLSRDRARFPDRVQELRLLQMAA